MQKELFRLQDYFKNYPDIEVWVIGDRRKTAEYYWKCIKEHIETNKKPIFNSPSTLATRGEGLNPDDAIIVLCGHWYENKHSCNGLFQYYLNNAKFTLPIGEMPDHIINKGETNNE